MFVISLVIVLAAGSLAMLGYAAVMPNGEPEAPIIVDFAGIGQQNSPSRDESAGTPGDAAAGETASQPVSSEQVEPTVEDAIAAENERLLNEAVQKGENVHLVNCADSDRVTFAFAGDILLDDEYAMMFHYRTRGSDINDTFSADLLERMRSADVFMLNNEFPFSSRGTPTENKTFTFRADPANVDMYELLGVDVVSLANNHAYDYGEEALLDTFATLEEAGIPYVGAGRNIDEAKKPVYFIANGIKIAVVSATQIERNAVPDTREATATSAGVLRCMDPSALLEVIAEAKENSDFVILYIHWGTESQAETDWLQDKQAPVYAQAGVDLIVGDHPHCLQKLDSESGVPVVYSLGNYWFNSKTQNTCLVEVGIKKEGMEYFRFVPCIQEDCRTRQLEGSEKAEVLNYMRGLSPGVSIDDEGYVTFGS
ncbi:MAG: CapA family protein [Lachnospiraceae bacterium]|nr:CapA family protein [Lachnospiraceae bacterium]MDE6999117.1 CapA family protein [Lachnospiraceae bacterium]